MNVFRVFTGIIAVATGFWSPAASCAGTPPTVSIVTPCSTEYDNVLTLTANAQATTHGATIDHVDFSYNGTIFSTLTKPWFGHTYQTTFMEQDGTYYLPPGGYPFTAVATDSQGLTASSTVTCTWSVPWPPTVTLNVDAKYVASEPVTVVAWVKDAGEPIAKVDFYLNGVLQGTRTSSLSYSLSGDEYDFAYLNVPVGTATFQAIATDSYGVAGPSAAVKAKVTAAPPQPSIALTAPLNKANYHAPAAIPFHVTTTTSASSASIGRVDYYLGSKVIGSSTTPPFDFTWSGVAAGQYYVSATATESTGLTASSSGAAINVDDGTSCKDGVAWQAMNQQRAREAARNARVAFEPNAGQAPDGVRYVAHAPGYYMAFSDDGYAVTVRGHAGEATATVSARLVGAAPKPRIEALEKQAGVTDYFIGASPKDWHTGVPSFGRLRYASVYPGIDQVFHADDARAEYDFVVAAGADPGRIRIATTGVKRMHVDRDGDLVLETIVGALRQKKPVAYQLVDGVRRPVEARYRLSRHSEIAFAVGDYDHGRPLVIDPVLVYELFFGDENDPWVNAVGVALGTCGQAYIFGSSISPHLPVTPGAYHSDVIPSRADQVGFVTRLNESGTGPIYSAYIGAGITKVTAAAVDSSGALVFAGTTTGDGFAATPGAFMTTRPDMPYYNMHTGFVAKLDPEGSSLTYATYFRGDVSAMALGPDGSAYLTGTTLDAGFQTTQGAFMATPSTFRYGGFVTKLNPMGSGETYSTYLGGSTEVHGIGLSGSCSAPDCYVGDFPAGIALDAAGNAYISGTTWASDFPLLNALQTQNYSMQQANATEPSAFVTEVNPSGTGLVYSTYLGSLGTLNAQGWCLCMRMDASAIAVDAAGAAYVAGSREDNSSVYGIGNAPFNWLGTSGDPTGSTVGYVAKIHPSGGSYDYFTQFGSSQCDTQSCYQSWTTPAGVAVDVDGSAWVGGQTQSTAIPLVNPLNNLTSGGFLAKLNPAGNAFTFSTMLDGSPMGIALDADGSAYVGGSGGLVAYAAKVNETHDTQAALSVTPPIGAIGTTTKLSARITGRTPSGTVAFMDATQTLGTAFSTDGAASLTVTTLAGGAHSLSAVYSGDAQNNPSTSPAVPYNVRSTGVPPAATMSGIVTGSILQSNATQSGLPVYKNLALPVTVSAAPGNVLASVSMIEDDGTAGAYSWNLAPGQTSLQSTFPSPTLGVGAHALQLVATDTLGNKTSLAPVRFAVDASGGSAAPTVAIVTPAPGAALVAPANINLTATATPASGAKITSVQYFLNGTVLGTPLTTSPFKYVWSGVQTGVYQLVAMATAAPTGGGTASIGYSTPLMVVVNDPGLPTGKQTMTTLQASPPTGAMNLPSTLIATVIGTPSPVGTVAFTDNGTAIGSAPVSSESARLAWTPTKAGSHKLVAQFTSSDENVNTDSKATLTYTVGDAQDAPISTLTGIADGKTFLAARDGRVAGLDVTLSASAVKGNTIAQDELFMLSGTGSSFWTWNGLAASTFTTPFTLPALSAGYYQLHATATDNFNNTGESGVTHFFVNPAGSTPPVVTWTGSTGTVTQPAPVTLAASVTQGGVDAIGSVSYYQGDTLIAAVTMAPFTYVWSGVAPGTYTVYAIGTDFHGASARSSSTTITVAPSQAPTVALTSPVKGAIKTAPATITLTASATTVAPATVSRLEFLESGNVVATAAAGSSTATISEPAGDYFFAARVTDSNGQIATSAVVGVAVGSAATAPPGVEVTSPLPYQSFDEPASVDLMASAFGLGSAVQSVQYVDELGQPIGTGGGASYLYTMKNLPAGTYTVAARATDKSGLHSDSREISFVVRQKIPLALMVTSPAASGGVITIADNHVRVLGTTRAPPNSSVNVNGLVGVILPDGSFFVNGVQLTTGSNTLNVTLTNPDGQTVSQQLMLNSTGPASFHFGVSPTASLGNLTTVVDLSAVFGKSFTHIDVLCADAVLETYKIVTRGTKASCTYPSASATGTLRIDVYAANGSSEQLVYTDSWSYYDESVATRFSTVRGVYINMLARLKLSDLSGALATCTWTQAPKMNAIFTSVGASTLPKVALQLGDVARARLEDRSSELTVVRPGPNGPEGYPVQILMSEDGIWRIDDM